MSYHHGNLRASTLALVDTVVRDQGVSAVTLRALAPELGVSHAAIAHHFGSRTGLLTAFAVEGFERLQEAVAGAQTFMDVGVAYVEFAARNPAHFAVMYTPSLLNDDDPELQRARARSQESLLRAAANRDGTAGQQTRTEALAGWALMHGLASLHGTGALQASGLMPASTVEDMRQVARAAGALLFGESHAVEEDGGQTG